MTLYAGRYGPSGIEYPDGRHATDTEVTVLRLDRVAAVLYVDREKSGVAPNPLLTDALGNVQFWVDPGEYLLSLPEMELEVMVPLHPDEPVQLGAGSFLYTQTLPESIWDCPHPLSYPPSGVRVFVQNIPVIAPVFYGNGRIYVHHGGPCTGTVRMS
jgi:hypothetical protein